MARIIVVEGPITMDTCYMVKESIRQLVEKAPLPIVLMVSSTGGDAYAGFSIQALIRNAPVEIWTVGFGPIMSAGTLVFGSGTPGRRYLEPDARVMIHLPTASVRPDREGGLIDDLHNQACRLTAVITGKTPEMISELGADDLYMSAQEAIDFGLADGLIDPGEMPG